MTSLMKKGVYLKPEQVEILATLVYESRKENKRHISESMLIRIAVELLIQSDIDFSKYDSEEEILAAIRSCN